MSESDKNCPACGEPDHGDQPYGFCLGISKELSGSQDRAAAANQKVKWMEEQLAAMTARAEKAEADLHEQCNYNVQLRRNEAYWKAECDRAKADRDRLTSENHRYQEILITAESDNDRLLDTMLAAGFIGNGTQIVGDKRYEELCKAEKDLKGICGECKPAEVQEWMGNHTTCDLCSTSLLDDVDGPSLLCSECSSELHASEDDVAKDRARLAQELAEAQRILGVQIKSSDALSAALEVANQELAESQADADLSNGCLHMIRDRLMNIGCKHGPDTHKSTPPMNYDDWISCVVLSYATKENAAVNHELAVEKNATAAWRARADSETLMADQASLDHDAVNQELAEAQKNVKTCPTCGEKVYAEHDIYGPADCPRCVIHETYTDALLSWKTFCVKLESWTCPCRSTLPR